ncbi:membrane-bound PQQ-dependent dehydrogenase, glucose/quinate/shikimate family [Pseudoxanthomonas putridarboris]|uniref:Membrane-bound PQQ-dependent dehydrogenase, glucose/quinate/shikimate family n=1 Tax=Pseudoxanthomonas putridarboris TaxID=752605 RepID=A0ABU9J0U1_9GAMM
MDSHKGRILYQACKWGFIALTLCASFALLAGGARLLYLGGSSYYLIAGLAYLALSVMLSIRNRFALHLSAAIFLATCVWALYEVQGLKYWELLPRLVVPALIFMLGLWLIATFPSTRPRTRQWANRSALVVFFALLATLVAAFFPHGKISNPVEIARSPERSRADTPHPENWEFFGRNAHGTRFAPHAQITPDNVKDLQVAWTYRTGRETTGPAAGVDQNTPLQIGNVLYSCTPQNIVTALDADTGRPLWKFDPQARTAEHVTCRGVGYHDIEHDENPGAAENAIGIDTQCRQRILVSTVDARLFALDARTGGACPGFGENGFVDLKKNMGPTQDSKRYHPTSIPVVMGHLAVIGGWVRDIEDGEPSGVVRAFDVRDGSLAWAWDVGAPESADTDRTDREFTLATPNVWSIPTYDRELNLVYLPTGNGPPDYWGGDRNAVKEKFGSAVVAVDAATGKTRWVYQIVRHDVWDYDIPSQPVLHDVENARGEKVPALIQTTKTGHIFVLDRRTGQPVTAVEERPVPTSPAAQGERLSPTQPFSVGMPVIGAEPLTERSMWGITPFDQLYCRIKFKDSHYQGAFTPPTEKPYIEWPSLLGGMNWGGISIDESRNLMFVNDTRMALRMSLVTREQAKQYKISTDEVPGFMGTIRPQLAGPYGGVRIDILQSPLGVPCPAPPFGTMSAIDLRTRQLVWQVPLGTVQDTGPLGIKTHLPMPIGMPTLGGPTSTASGLVFFAGTQDYYLRALDATTGRELWKGRLPVGAVAAPLVYQSPATGRQYVVISAGGASHSPDVGDYVIAYALPDRTRGK